MSTFRIVYGTMSNGVPITDQTPSYQLDEADTNTTYLRYEDTTASQFIRKILKASTITTNLKAIGTWANRTTLTYVDINS